MPLAGSGTDEVKGDYSPDNHWHFHHTAASAEGGNKHNSDTASSLPMERGERGTGWAQRVQPPVPARPYRPHCRWARRAEPHKPQSCLRATPWACLVPLCITGLATPGCRASLTPWWPWGHPGDTAGSWGGWHILCGLAGGRQGNEMC